MIYVDDLLASRYRYNGRSIDEGFDCYGLAIEVCRRMGHVIPDLDEARCRERNFLACLKKGAGMCPVRKVKLPEKEGDVIFFEDYQGAAYHIGIYLGEGLFIHCNFHGVHIEHLGRSIRYIGQVYTWL